MEFNDQQEIWRLQKYFFLYLFFLIFEINLFYSFQGFKVLSFLIPIYLVYINSELRKKYLYIELIEQCSG